ncbi:hypothetical protein LJC34_02455 [Oscillospiraceae bacterium OttesenSCG-928-G22]|nr:hypothetical protein [Oscillospiraceae bacterium OttesenSCG-928-G22]
MISHWKIDARLDADPYLYVDGYRWDENGLIIKYTHENETIGVTITFSNQVEYVQVKFKSSWTLQYEEEIIAAMQAANVDGPINAFFIENDLSEAYKNSLGLYLDVEGDISQFDLTKYMMIDEDLWITVISSTLPIISVHEFE